MAGEAQSDSAFRRLGSLVDSQWPRLGQDKDRIRNSARVGPREVAGANPFNFTDERRHSKSDD